MKLALRDGWYLREIDPALDLSLPGIYEWRIEGVGLYVGKAKKLQSRLRAYPNNVRRMVEGLPWHGNPNREYRAVHRALHQAYGEQTTVTVHVLETCATEDRSAREALWIARRRAEHREGGPAVLNG